MTRKKEGWNSRIGLILAVAGNAVGLGNFLRFPTQAVENGGGAFMIPYFIALFLLGIPLMWVEWGIGRRGGRYGHHSTPGMFASLWKHPIAKYFGALGLFISLAVMVYYTYIESWTLAYSFFSLFGLYFDQNTFESSKNFLQSYQGLTQGPHFSSILPAYGFLMVTVILNFWILRRGISGGIEKLARIAMPALFIFAILLVIRVLTFTPDPAIHKGTLWEGFSFMWTPDLSVLNNPKVWLAAAGQIFFTLSVGMGTIHAYASYMKPDEDIVGAGLATSGLNEFAEVALGGSIAIPISVIFFGVAATQEIAVGGSFNLGFVSMPVIFSTLPFGEFFGFLWFLLLFIAGITSSVAMAQPVIAFLEDEFGWTKDRAIFVIFFLTFLCIQPNVFFLKHGFLDEFDYWTGTFLLAVFALGEILIFVWALGVEGSWKEINRGANIRIPSMFKYIIAFITPLYLMFIFVFWTIDEKGAISVLRLDGVPDSDIPYRWGARALMLVFFAAICWMVAHAWKKRAARGLSDTDVALADTDITLQDSAS